MAFNLDLAGPVFSGNSASTIVTDLTGMTSTYIPHVTTLEDVPAVQIR
jgi:hypothetical protein